MKRYTHSFSPEFSSASKFHQLACMGRVDLLPGETVHGRIKTRLVTDTLIKPILNSTVLDMFVFYVPYRVAWDSFPDFITNGSPGIPTRTAAAPFLYENGTITRSELPRLAYQSVFNHYFRDPDETEIAGNQTVEADVNRIPTFSSQLATTATGSAIYEAPVVGAVAQIDLQDLRDAHAEDRERRSGLMFGNDYADLLARMGVRADVRLLDRPEVWAHKRCPLNTSTVYNTSEVTTGVPSSVMDVTCDMMLDKKMSGEHGIMLVLGVVRNRMANSISGGPVDSFKTDREDFWLPGHERGVEESYSPLSFGPAATGTVFGPRGHQYRMAEDHCSPRTGSTTAEFYMTSAFPAGAITEPNLRKFVTAADFNPYFRNSIGSQFHFCHSTWMGLKRTNVVPPVARG